MCCAHSFESSLAIVTRPGNNDLCNPDSEGGTLSRDKDLISRSSASNEGRVNSPSVKGVLVTEDMEKSMLLFASMANLVKGILNTCGIVIILVADRRDPIPVKNNHEIYVSFYIILYTT